MLSKNMLITLFMLFSDFTAEHMHVYNVAFHLKVHCYDLKRKKICQWILSYLTLFWILYKNNKINKRPRSEKSPRIIAAMS